MKYLYVIAAYVLLPISAFAQEPAAAPAYAVPVETLEIGNARTRLMEAGGSAGGYSVVARTSATQTSFLTRDRGRVRLSYRFTGAEDADLLTGVCELKTEGRSFAGFSWDQRTSQLYACSAADQPEGTYALEVRLPTFGSGGFENDRFGISIGGDDASPEAQAILAARLTYEGVIYEAAPTSFSAPRLMAPDRIVLGYTISRDGQPVGRIEFRGNSRNRGTIIAPVADVDGRRAVLFMALQLLAMPDFYSSNVRETYLNR